MSVIVLQDVKFSLKLFQYIYIKRVFEVWETLNYKILMETDVIYKRLYSTVKNVPLITKLREKEYNWFLSHTAFIEASHLLNYGFCVIIFSFPFSSFLYFSTLPDMPYLPSKMQ
jgi:hypothetical protein